MALKPCPECGAQVSDDAKACPSCGKPVPDKNAALGVGACLALVVVLLIIGWVNTTFFHGSDPTADDRQSAAVEACRESVRAQLKSPGSASFSGEQYRETNDVYSITGQVDAENSFGASLRSDFTCVAEPVGDGGTYTATAAVTD